MQVGDRLEPINDHFPVMAHWAQKLTLIVEAIEGDYVRIRIEEWSLSVWQLRFNYRVKS